VQDVIGPQRDRQLQNGRGEGVVDDDLGARFVSDAGDGRDPGAHDVGVRPDLPAAWA